MVVISSVASRVAVLHHHNKMYFLEWPPDGGGSYGKNQWETQSCLDMFGRPDTRSGPRYTSGHVPP